MIKNIVTISLIIFVVAVISILGAGVFLSQPKINTPATTQTQIQTTITSAQLLQHGTSSSCWMVINSKVYNLTSYLSMHPIDISNYCGKDGTTAFNTKGGKGQHSQKAVNLLNNYYIGNFGG